MTNPTTSQGAEELAAKLNARADNHARMFYGTIDATTDREAASLLLSQASALEALKGENARLAPKPNPASDFYSVVYRPGPPTPEDYDEAIADLQRARTALIEGDSMGCRVCEDSGHGANNCHHNALLLARKWAAATRIWQCWHCGYIATNDEEGRAHFGEHDGEQPACLQEALARADRAEKELAGRRKALQEIEQIAGKALGYPWFKDDPKNFPDATEADGVCIGEHVAESIVEELADRLQAAEAAIARKDEALKVLADPFLSGWASGEDPSHVVIGKVKQIALAAVQPQEKPQGMWVEIGPDVRIWRAKKDPDHAD